MNCVETSLIDVVNIKTGKLNSNAAVINGEYPFFTCAPEPLKIDKYKYDQAAILLAGNNADGNFHINYYEGKFEAYQRTYIIDSKDESKYDLEYLFYALKECLQEFKLMSQGTSTKFLTMTILNGFKLNIPDIIFQRKIARILSSIDRKIKNNNQINRNLSEQAFTQFKEMFPNANQGEHTLGEYLSAVKGKALLSKDAVEGDVPVIAGGLSPATYHNVANTKAPVLTISASGANAGYVALWNQDVWSSDSSYIDSNMTENVYFWYAMLKTRQEEIFDAQTGSAQPHIYPKNIDVLPVIELDDRSMTEYTMQVSPLFEMIGENLKENDRLSALRDSLLPKLMSGELDVSELEI